MKVCQMCNNSLSSPSIPEFTVVYSHDDKEFCSNECIFKYDLKNDAPLFNSDDFEPELGNLFFGNSRGEYQLNRSVWRREFMEFRGFWDFLLEGKEFENEVFILRPYYWGEDETFRELPNFVHKRSGLSLEWYKHPYRDSYSNKKVTLTELKEIIQECVKSL